MDTLRALALALMLVAVLTATASAEKPALAIVIDDVGLRPEPIDIFLEIEAVRGKITWAVIPSAPYAMTLTQRLVDRGEAVIAHIPMEPQDPTQRAAHLGTYLSASMTPAQLRGELHRQLDLFPAMLRPFVRGINNHQGSGLTTSEASMSAVLTTLKKRGLYFLDSRTTAQTVATKLALKHGVAHTQRDVFLDNERSVEAIVERLDEAAKRAQDHGSAVAIGHPYPETAMALAYWLNRRPVSVTLVRVETLLRGMVRPHK